MAITSQDRLGIYNDALTRLGSRRLASLSENREPRRVLDDVWGAGNALARYMLERGEWNFAIRTGEMEYSPSVEPEFGFRRAFDKPDDFVRLAGLSADPYFRQPLTSGQYVDEATFWFSDHDTIYVRYVSDGDDYGFNSAGWTEGFRVALACRMAWLACERLTNSASRRQTLEGEMLRELSAAKSHDAMAEGAKFLPQGSWLRARSGGKLRP